MNQVHCCLPSVLLQRVNNWTECQLEGRYVRLSRHDHLPHHQHPKVPGDRDRGQLRVDQQCEHHYHQLRAD